MHVNYKTYDETSLFWMVIYPMYGNSVLRKIKVPAAGCFWSFRLIGLATHTNYWVMKNIHNNWLSLIYFNSVSQNNMIDKGLGLIKITEHLITCIVTFPFFLRTFAASLKILRQNSQLIPSTLWKLSFIAIKHQDKITYLTWAMLYIILFQWG